MALRMNCPVCGSDMRRRSLLPSVVLKPYRVCPDCQTKYTADADTKKRELVLLACVALTLAASAAGFRAGYPWGIVAALFGAGSLLYAGYALSKMSYVKYGD